MSNSDSMYKKDSFCTRVTWLWGYMKKCLVRIIEFSEWHKYTGALQEIQLIRMYSS